MELLGRMAAGIAHDFGNLLAVILGYTDSILAAPDLPSAVRNDALDIKSAGERGAALTAQLLAFSSGRAALEPADLNDVVACAAPMLERLLGRSLRLDLSLEGDLPRVTAGRSRLEQVLFNLVLNARDAMPDGGAIRVQTSTRRIGETRARAIGLSPGLYVVLSVEDDGLGMDGAIRARAFDPFFTTKGTSGTGLGLSVVRRIARESGGDVRLTTEAGRGARFDVYLRPAD